MTTNDSLYELVLNMFLLLLGGQTMIAVSMFILIHIIRVERAGIAQRRRLTWVRALTLIQIVVFFMLILSMLDQIRSV